MTRYHEPPSHRARVWTRPGLAALAGTLALLVLPSTIHAQDDPRLRDALRLAQEGASDSARAVVTGLLRVTPPTDSLYPQALYTMGLVSRSVDDMRRNYTRVAVEFTNSGWADDAIYRLGLLDYAAGSVAGAIRQMDRLRADYPDSPLLSNAAEWAARALFDQHKPVEACGWLATALERAGDDVELRNRLDFLNGRCTPTALADTAKPPAPAPTTTATTTAPAPGTRQGFAVQVGAVNTQAAADKLAADLRAAGYTSYVVREGSLFKVRVGPYADRPAAAIAGEKIRQRLRSSPFVVKEP